MELIVVEIPVMLFHIYIIVPGTNSPIGDRLASEFGSWPEVCQKCQKKMSTTTYIKESGDITFGAASGRTLNYSTDNRFRVKILRALDSYLDIVIDIDPYLNIRVHIESYLNIGVHINSYLNIGVHIESYLNIGVHINSYLNIGVHIDSYLDIRVQIDSYLHIGVHSDS